MEVQELLQTAASAVVGNDVRAAAAEQLQIASREHFGPYMTTLAKILSTESEASLEVRMLAALAMKNELTAKNDREKRNKSERWVAGTLTSEEKQQIKATALNALAYLNNGVASTAAQLVAAIATIELPRGEWSDLTVLLVGMTSPDQQSSFKKAALTTIGYICEAANPADAKLEEQMNGFLTAIVQAAQKSEPDGSVRLAAINALYNSLEYIKNNFAREGERNLIMMTICEATRNTDDELQSATFGCLAKVMNLYYEYMQPYMEQALFALTVEGMRSDHDSVKCMAIEFWNTVSDVEFELQYAEDDGPPSTLQSFHFVSQAVEQVLPTILKLLVKEDQDQDEDEWNSTMAAGTCVELMAKTAGDSVLDIVMTFVGPMIQSAKWNEREAAVMAFGSSLDGPNRERLVAIVHGSLQPLCAMIKDSCLSVRETVAWCLGRIADYVISGFDSEQTLQTILEAVVLGLSDDSKVVTHCCWAIMNLSEQLNPIPHTSTSSLSPFYEVLLSTLMQTSNRMDNEHSARTSAYEALSSLIIYAPNDVLHFVMGCSSACDVRMRQSLEFQNQVVSVDDRQNVEELQINLLGLLTSIIRRVENQVASSADSIMELLGEFLNRKFPNSLVEDDVFIAIGAIAASVGEYFGKYVAVLVPYIVAALKETEFSISGTAVGLITDITHALGDNIEPYVQGFMSELSKIITNYDSVRPDLIPPTLSCIGDLAAAAAMFGSFDIFLAEVERIITEIAQNTQFTSDANIEYQIHVAKVKEAIVDAQVGILAGYRDAPDKLKPYIPLIFSYLKSLREDPVMTQLASSSLVRTIVGIIGDIGSMYPDKQFKGLFQEPWVTNIIEEAIANVDSYDSARTGQYARDEQRFQLS